jgi:hypothetical protein
MSKFDRGRLIVPISIFNRSQLSVHAFMRAAIFATKPFSIPVAEAQSVRFNKDRQSNRGGLEMTRQDG